MRASSVILAAFVAVIAVMASACGSPAPKISASKLFQEYTKSTDVKNDKFKSNGSSADRLANFAAYYSPEQLQAELLSASPCETADDCPQGREVNEAVKDFTGAAAGTVSERSILVKRDGGSLELITLYVASKSDKNAVLIDPNGKSYTGLEDFRQNNDLFSSQDVILTPRDITAVPGKGEVVAVSGHTATNWRPWLIGGIVVVAVLGAGLVVTRRLMTRSRAPGIDNP